MKISEPWQTRMLCNTEEKKNFYLKNKFKNTYFQITNLKKNPNNYFSTAWSAFMLLIEVYL